MINYLTKAFKWFFKLEAASLVFFFLLLQCDCFNFEQFRTLVIIILQYIRFTHILIGTQKFWFKFKYPPLDK